MMLAFLGLLGTRLGMVPSAPEHATHLSVVLPAHLQLYGVRPTMLAISPDGRRLAAIVDDGGVPRLFLRDLSEAEGIILPGTEGANSPFFSPDFSGMRTRAVRSNANADLTPATPEPRSESPLSVQLIATVIKKRLNPLKRKNLQCLNNKQTYNDNTVVLKSSPDKKHEIKQEQAA